MTTLCRVPCFPFWCPLVRSCVACPVSYVARLVAVIAVFLWCRRVCTLAVLLVPCFLSPVWGLVFGVWVWFCLVCRGFSGVVLLPCGCVYPSVCALLLGRVCLGWGWCVCGRVGVLCCAVVPFLVCMVCGLYVVCCFWYVCGFVFSVLVFCLLYVGV